MRAQERMSRATTAEQQHMYFHLAARAAFCRYLRFSCSSVFCCSSSFAYLFFYSLITAPSASPVFPLCLRGLLLIYIVIAAAAAALLITTKRSSRRDRGSRFNQKQQQQKTQFPIKSAKCSIEANFYGRPTPPVSPFTTFLFFSLLSCHSDQSFNNCFCLSPAVIVVGSLFMCARVCV